jgi:hypothetical protein
MTDPLVSIPQLAKNGNDILMTEGKVLVIDQEREVLVSDGTMDPHRGLYLVPLNHYGKENRALTVSPMNTAQRALKTAQVTNITTRVKEYEVKAIPNLIRFLHAAVGYPVIKTWSNAIEKNYYIGWPGLTAKRVRKYLLPSEHTAKGHLHMVRQGIKSTNKPVPVQGGPKRERSTSPQTKEHELGVFTINTTELEREVPMGTHLKNLIATDLLGRYPVTSRRGNKYMFVLYDYDSNLIIAEPIKSRNASNLVNGFDICYKALTMNGFKAKTIRLDNEISKEFIQYLNKENLTYQLASLGDHRVNPAEQAIQTYENHFIALLSGTNPSYPANCWDLLIPQVNITLNLLRASRIQSQLLAYAHIYGQFDYNKTPLAPAGCKILIHDRANERPSWANHGTDGFYIGPALQH